MLTKYSTLLFSFLFTLHLSAQDYQLPIFEYDSLLNLSYGISTNYQGEQENLTFDLYKPKGDSNCKRPIVILIHGGAWVLGSKEDADLVYMSRYFAKRGYVVANMNYRLGMQKPSSWNLYTLCDPVLFSPCAYIADSAEVYRANYRGMQDTKGLIRYMKGRATQDSTDVNNVYLIGESAGGFIALQTALMTSENQKPLPCQAIADAPNPDVDFSGYSCFPSTLNLSRPDLGPVSGELNQNGFDASVKGVGNFFGGILDGSLLENNSNLPFLYLFHQGSDIIVHYNYGKLLGRTSYECFAAVNLCQPYYFYPNAYGSKGIQNLLIGNGNTNFIAEIIENYEYQNDCFDNGHSIDYILTRLNSVNSNFTNIISASGNIPSENCNSSNVSEAFSNLIFPNPAESVLHLNLPGESKIIYDALGNKIVETRETTLDISHYPRGIYFVQLGKAYTKFIKI